jgi:ribosomal 50S subunit-recycling heat shock protein
LRLDKFLKASRLVKRRTLAKEVCDAQRVMVNGRPAKPGTDIQIGDTLTLDFGRRVLKVKVVELRDSASVGDARRMFEVLGEEVRPDW